MKEEEKEGGGHDDLWTAAVETLKSAARPPIAVDRDTHLNNKRRPVSPPAL